MSIEAMVWALNHAPCDNPTQKLVLLALANHARPDGTSAFPSVATIQRYTLLSERAIRVHLKGLERLGVISRCDDAIVAAYITRADRRPQGWNLNLRRGVQQVQVAEERGASGAADGVHVVPLRGAGGAPEPYMNRTEEPSIIMSDALAMCELLADLIHANGSLRPRVTKKWVTDMDRVMRLDGRTLEQVEHIIRWSQNHSFWRANIMSPYKLRMKFDQLRLQAVRDDQSSRLDGVREFLEG